MSTTMGRNNERLANIFGSATTVTKSVLLSSLFSRNYFSLSLRWVRGIKNKRKAKKPEASFELHFSYVPSLYMTLEKKSPHRLKNWYPPSTVSQVRRYVRQVPPDILVSLVKRDHVAGGDQRERKVLKVAWDHWDDLENRKWRVLHDREEKRETREGLGQNGMPGATGRPGKTGKTGPKRSRGERKIWENPGQKACRDQRNWEPWKIDICSTGNDVTCRSD